MSSLSRTLEIIHLHPLLIREEMGQFRETVNQIG